VDCEAINPASASVIQDAETLTMPLLFEGSYFVKDAESAGLDSIEDGPFWPFHFITPPPDAWFPPVGIANLLR
jgi:hypothetical protein